MPDSPLDTAPLKRPMINTEDKHPKIDIKSHLHEIVDKVNEIPDYEGKKKTALELINNLKINDADKRKMLVVIQYQCPNSYKLTTYLYNAMLKYKGLGSVAKKRDF